MDDPNEPRDTDILDFEVRLRRDLKKSAELLSTDQARYLVDLYYQLQHGRIVSGNIVRSSYDHKEPRDLVSWFMQRQYQLERNLKNILGAYAASKRAGAWAQSITGIGPVISAGLFAHIDTKKARYAGQVWRLAGLDPSIEWIGKEAARALVDKLWEKGRSPEENAAVVAGHSKRKAESLLRTASKGGKRAVTPATLASALSMRPWSASLKVLAWKIGESFVKVSSNPKDFYGKLYLNYKAREIGRNERGELADQAEAKLKRFRIGKSTEAYKHYSVGQLPPAHIHARAKRAAVKVFLSHYHAVAYECDHGERPPAPYALEHLIGHHEPIPIPNWD